MDKLTCCTKACGPAFRSWHPHNKLGMILHTPVTLTLGRMETRGPLGPKAMSIAEKHISRLGERERGETRPEGMKAEHNKGHPIPSKITQA